LTDTIKVDHYHPTEERWNIISHAFGFALSIVALGLLVTKALLYSDIWTSIIVGVFGLSLIILYGASTLYHYAKTAIIRSRLQVLDHAAIYILIAGTYTPFTLLTLNSATGWLIFTASWSMALVGIILKLFFTGKYDLLSTLMYVFMGWIIVFAIKPLIASIAHAGLMWLVAGGISYTLGAVLFSIDRLHFNHAIFHIFVLLGSFCHFIAVYYYVLPNA